MSSRPSRRAAATRRTIVESEDEDEIAGDTTRRIKEEEEDFNPEPAPQTTRRQTQSRRRSAAPASTASASTASGAAPRRGRPKRSTARESTSTVATAADTSVAETTSIAPESAEPSEVADADQSAATVVPPDTPPKTTTRKRRSAAPRRSRASVEPTEEPAAEPVPEPTLETIPEPAAEPAPESAPEPQASSSRAHTPTRPEAPSKVADTPLADATQQNANDQRSPADENLTQVKPIKAMDTILEKPMDIVLKSRQMPQPVVEETGPKPRIVITYLILNNFKSYAGRQEVGPFHSSFSSVVGPNGSGKSNVIDSLLFVFGFRASKMRQGKISALIHNSAAHPNLDHCEVAVHFQEVMDLVCHMLFLLKLKYEVLTRL
ncbi:RecF/RecN/SMC N terminal domain-containing protein [Biscogniauxia sp. FL1348]|nr:RecF/RecN/SMC N terminal domain-containing protein [Biscogniauxia sp. FL1348]